MLHGSLLLTELEMRRQSVIESHSETTPSLRLTNPFPALKQWAADVDYSKLDPTDHGHIPFAVILVREAEHWKAQVRDECNSFSVPLLTNCWIARRQDATDVRREAGVQGCDCRA